MKRLRHVINLQSAADIILAAAVIKRDRLGAAEQEREVDHVSVIVIWRIIDAHVEQALAVNQVDEWEVLPFGGADAQLGGWPIIHEPAAVHQPDVILTAAFGPDGHV